MKALLKIKYKLYLILSILIMVPQILSCKSHDSQYFPYRMKGINILVYNNKTSEEFFVGFIKANYFSRKDGLATCQNRAAEYAKVNDIPDWSYMCCTVTSYSSCATKVK